MLLHQRSTSCCRLKGYGGLKSIILYLQQGTPKIVWLIIQGYGDSLKVETWTTLLAGSTCKCRAFVLPFVFPGYHRSFLHLPGFLCSLTPAVPQGLLSNLRQTTHCARLFTQECLRTVRSEAPSRQHPVETKCTHSKTHTHTTSIPRSHFLLSLSHVHTHTHMHVCLHASMPACLHVWIHVCMYGIPKPMY